jgi:hypothetical protein
MAISLSHLSSIKHITARQIIISLYKPYTVSTRQKPFTPPETSTATDASYYLEGEYFVPVRQETKSKSICGKKHSNIHMYTEIKTCVKIKAFKIYTNSG